MRSNLYKSRFCLLFCLFSLSSFFLLPQKITVVLFSLFSFLLPFRNLQTAFNYHTNEKEIGQRKNIHRHTDILMTLEIEKKGINGHRFIRVNNQRA